MNLNGLTKDLASQTFSIEQQEYLKGFFVGLQQLRRKSAVELAFRLP